MEIDAKKRKFFEDEVKMRKQYGIYAPYVLPYYKKLCEYAPEASEEIFTKLFHTKIRFGTKDTECDAYSIKIRLKGRIYANSIRINSANPSDVKGYNQKFEYVTMTPDDVLLEGMMYHQNTLNSIEDEFHDRVPIPDAVDTVEIMNRYKRKAKIDKKLGEWMRLEDNNRRFSVFHELNHCMANKKMIWLKKDVNPQTYYEAVKNAQDVDIYTTDYHNLAIIYGNSCVYVHNVCDGKMADLVFTSERSCLYEDAIVEDMANSLGCELGLSSWDLQQFYTQKIGPCYRPFVYLVGMWNIASNNDLRKVYLTGKNDFSPTGTFGFDMLFNEFTRFCVPGQTLPNKVGYRVFGYELIADSLAKVIQFTDKKFKQNSKNITKEQKQLYRFYRTESLKPDVLLNYMEDYTDFGEDKQKLSILLNEYYRSSMHTRQDISVSVDKKLEDNQSLIM